jgi:MFS family permease
MMGTAIAAATAGGLIGPVVGAIARGLGTAPTFGAISAISAVMLVAVAALPIRDVRKVATGPGGLRPALRQPVIARGLWLVACAALMFGALNLLLPLHLDSAGASGALIASVWLASAAFESIVNPLAGRYADRHGWRGVARAGLLGGAVIVLLAPLPNAVALLALIGILSGPVIGLLWSPAMMLLGEGSDQAGFDHTYAFALMNLAWASAQTVATVGGGALAQATRDVGPLAIVAAVALTTAASLVRARKPVLVREA